jgi:Tol biopolymer transport system component
MYPYGVYHPSDLYLLDLGSQTFQQLTDTPSISEESPAVSPDGHSLAYVIVEDKDLEHGERGRRGISVQAESQDPVTFYFPALEGVLHLSWYGEGLVFRAYYEGGVFDHSGLYFFDPNNADSVRELLNDYHVPGATAEFAWSAAAGRFAIVTVGTPAGNDLVIASTFVEG